LPKTEPATGFSLRELHVVYDDVARGAAMQMALDELLLECAAKPTLRFYRWQRPSLSFGYFGRYTDVAGDASARDVVRRWTGGGIVLHGEDVTYALIVPAQFLDGRTRARAVYSFVHDAIVRSLAAHVPSELAPADAPKVSEACFANAVAADVLADGRKIAGAAQRRTRVGLLQQGSVQFERLPMTFAVDLATALCSTPEEIHLAEPLVSRATALAAAKYASPQWLHRH
jgi:lipoyl(octanoyl) transferase